MIVCLWTLFGICGGGANPPLETGKVSVDETGTAQTNEHGTVYADESETTAEETRIDVDATTSASLLAPGNAPWGNLSIFYQDFQNSGGLISLGRIEEGMDVISAMEGDFVVILTKTED